MRRAKSLFGVLVMSVAGIVLGSFSSANASSDSRTPYIGQAFMPMTWEHPPLFDQDVRESL